jgi:hypothetical protein
MPEASNAKGGFGCPVPHTKRDVVWILVGAALGAAITVAVGGCCSGCSKTSNGSCCKKSVSES